MSKLTKVDFIALNKGIEVAIPTSAPTPKKKWVDGKATEDFDSTVFEVAIKDVGICQVSFPYRPELAEELDDVLQFGVPVDLNMLGSVTNLQVYLYDKGLNIRIMMQEDR